MKAVITANARRDLFTILASSRAQFGRDAQKRYRPLLQQAIADAAADPQRLGAYRPRDVAADLWVYHSRRAAAQAPRSLRIGRPRHVLVFRLRGQTVEILRILHDAMDLPRHLDDA